MNPVVFGYVEFQTLIERFAAELPRLLERHPLTATLVQRVTGLLDAAETPFTVAIVGQMRVGKSSLLNALVGRDLAVTGVTETTATINWFRYGAGAQLDRFRVHWKDRPAEDFDRRHIGRWVGDSEQAAATRCIDFFADADFLKVANIVDTPGTRSTIMAHEEATQEFMGLRHDSETRRLGSQADAVIYVLMPVARETDQTFLSAFRDNTRLPGSSAYNSLAVLHKFETLEEEDLLDGATKKAGRVQDALRESVACVLPVSAPLAMAAARFDAGFWSSLLQLVRRSTDDALRAVLQSDQRFDGREAPGCALDAATRRRLREQYRLPWPSLRLTVRLARQCTSEDPEKIRTYVQEASGIDRLRRELDRRFFSRTRVIKAFSLLAKAWEPCQIAQTRLRNQKVSLAEALERAGDLVELLESRISAGDAALTPVLDYVRTSRSAVQREVEDVGELLRRISDAVLPIQDAYDDMNGDLKALEILDSKAGELEPETLRQLRALFGHNGPDLQSRLAAADASVGNAVAVIEASIAKYRRLEREWPRDLRPVAEHAVARLEQMADALEAARTLRVDE